MGREEDLQTPAGNMASVAAALVRRRGDLPGVWDFLEEFKPAMDLIQLETRLAENTQAQTAAAAEEGKRLYLYKRGLELSDAILAAKAKIYERDHRGRP